jgi:hypothetical protein
MADKKITDLAAIASVAGADLVAVVDDVAGTPTTTKATVDQVFSNRDFCSFGATPASAGTIRLPDGASLYSTSGGVDRPLVSHSSSVIVLGGFSANECGGIYNRISSTCDWRVQIAGTNQLVVNETRTALGTVLDIKTNPSTFGDINLPSSSSGIASISNTAGVDMVWMKSFGNDLHIGASHAGGTKVPGNLTLWNGGDQIQQIGGEAYWVVGASQRFRFWCGGNELYRLGSASALFAKPILGFDTPQGAVNGRALLPNGAAGTYVVLSADYSMAGIYIPSGALYSTVLMPHPANESGTYYKPFENLLMSPMTISTGTGSTYALPAGASRILAFTPYGVAATHT